MTKTDPAEAGPRILMVLESYPPSLPAAGEALPDGSAWFAAACGRWGLSPELLAAARRINALDRPPAGNWYPGARARVRAAILEYQPEVVIAAGWVARSAVCGALRLPARPVWLEPVEASLPASRCAVRVLAVPHFSGRSRPLNDQGMRRATRAALIAALQCGQAERGALLPR
jgi:hypothetical protein